MKKQIFALMLGALLSLTACGESTPTKHEVDQFLPGPGDDPSKTKTIKFWHCLGQAKTDNLEKVRDKFNETYRGKYKVELKALAGDYRSLSSDVMTKYQAGSVPAITMGYPDTFADLISSNIEYSAILRLDNFINDANYGYAKITDPDDPNYGLLDDFVPAYYKEGTGYQFEGTWSMPMYKSTEVMYYNLSYFSGVNPMNDQKFKGVTAYTSRKAKAIDTQDDEVLQSLKDLKTWVKANGGFYYEVPETWQGLIELGEQILDDYNGTKKGFYPIGYDSDSNLLISQLEQRGYKYTTNDNIVEEKDHFLFGDANNKENTKKLVTEIVDMIKTKKILKTKNTNGNSYTSDNFKEQKCVISIGSTGGSTYQDSSSFVTGLAPVPAFAEETEDGTVIHRKYIQQGPSICFFDNKDPYIHKGAWLFYRMMADPENNVRLALDNSYDPIRISSYSTEYYTDFIDKAGEHLGLQYDIPAITSTLTSYYMTSPVFKGSSTARDEIGKILTYVIRNNKSIADAIAKAYKNCF